MSGVGWAAYLLAGAIFDFVADKRGKGETLSENTRIVIRAFPHGTAVFTGLCVAVPAWFWFHIKRHL